MIDRTECRISEDASHVLATLRRFHAAAEAEAGNDGVVDLVALLADHAHNAEVLAALRRG